MSRPTIVIDKETCLQRLNQQGDTLGIAEVAEVLGIKKQVAVGWMNKKRLPEPNQVLAMGSIWTKTAIEDFIKSQPDVEPGTEEVEDAVQPTA